ncbi:MAG: hypothetical protein AVDCRST_MAG66-4748 [uncultured Pseudonocardia sp.]|uniref:Uncharacterized protein n=1 Tax=uncultured Pseudonocardia sp. TaxID=211455 RepID=A0A6J4QTX0_9PSEU|nr:MAG: hypothetical protein AVDCRST_MAG66-4748 [uncultured Pseudonocardia sp.]
MVAYTAYYLSPPGSWFVLDEDSLRRLGVVLLTSPVILYVVLTLKRRAERLAATETRERVLREHNAGLREQVPARTEWPSGAVVP